MRVLRTLLVGLVAVVAGLLAPAAATAGGWAVVNFDETPALAAEETSDVGFTLLRHGQTPESSTDITFVLSGDGGRFVFTPVPDSDVVGHHTVSITVPTAGSYEFTVYGPFVPIELGTIDVSAASATSTGGPSVVWNLAVWGSAALAVFLALVVMIDLIRRRGGHAAPTDTPNALA